MVFQHGNFVSLLLTATWYHFCLPQLRITVAYRNFVSLLLTATSRSISGGTSRGISAGSLISISAGSSGGISRGISEGWMHETKTFAKVADLVPLGVLFGPGAPDPDLGHSQIRV